MQGCQPSDDGSNADAARGTDVTTIGGTATSDGDCADEQADLAASHDHVDSGTTMDYSGIPPVSGNHWAVAPDITKTLYQANERPELGELVHSEEHGWTIVWYDESIANHAGSTAALSGAAQTVDQATVTKVVFVPWTAADGDQFPDDAHVAITHWGNDDDGTEYRQFCGSPSAAAVLAFADRHPATESREPNAP